MLKDHLPPPIRAAGRRVRASVDLVRRHRTKKIRYPMAQHLKAIIKHFAIDLVLDVGANTGQFGTFIRRDVGFDGDIISFEPVKVTFSKLAGSASGDPRWRVVNAAAGDVPGSLPINVTRDSVFTSFRRPSEGNLFEAENSIVSSEIVSVCRLDDYLSQNDVKAESILLKADTQGFDLDVIRGAAGILDRINAVQTELSFIPIYESMPTYKTVIDEMRSLDFVVSNMFPVTLTRLQAIEFDCILVRSSPIVSGYSAPYEYVLLDAGRNR